MAATETITALSTRPVRPGRIRVEIDGVYAFELSRKIILALNVTLGETLAPGRRRELETIAAREAAVGLLTRRERSRAELATALRRKRFAPEAVTAALNQLMVEGLQSDERFAGAWVSTRRRLSPRGRTALAYELKQKGIDKAEAAQALARYTLADERKALRELIAMRLARMTAAETDREKVKRRLMGFLARRGFSYEDIRVVLTEHFPDWT